MPKGLSGIIDELIKAQHQQAKPLGMEPVNHQANL
jgi:hypothetical protein